MNDETKKYIDDLNLQTNTKIFKIMELCGICTRCQENLMKIGATACYPPKYYCPKCDKVIIITPKHQTLTCKKDDDSDMEFGKFD